MESIKTPKVDNVALQERFSSRRNSIGSLYLTATHLIYVDRDNDRETWILHSHITNVTKLPLTTNGSPIQVRTKTFLCMTFVIPREREAHDLHTSLVLLSQPSGFEELYSFRYNTGSKESLEKGWVPFDLQAEYERMGVPNDYWVLSNLNFKYELCDTYPSYLFVPASASTAVLNGSAQFRSRHRLPVLTYLHKNKASLCRCSQPLSGFNARCEEDEKLIIAIQRANPNTSSLVIVDTRPRVNAMANRAAGKGYESEANYENTRFQFAGIENIHVMRSSLQRLLETCELKTPAMAAFLNGVESSGWLKHIKAILDSAVFIAKTLEEGTSVLVHCSDGWDRTAQVCALSQILLEPYYRSLKGFQALVEKEWLSFGFKFTDRCGHIQVDPKEVSPVFTQWIECIWHLTQQFPHAFEFNEKFLIALHDHVHSCQFGNFLGNCQKDRIDLRLHERTYSFWRNVDSNVSELLNPMYDRTIHCGFLQPNLVPQVFKFWREMYGRWESGFHPREPVTDLLIASKNHIISLEDHIRYLQARIEAVEKKFEEIGEKKSSAGADTPKHKLVHEKSPLYDPLMSNSGMDSFTLSKSCDTEKGNSKSGSGVLNLVAIDWKTFRGVKLCSCNAPFDFSSRKSHCWACGNIYCERCLENAVALPAHQEQKQSPICRDCFHKYTKLISAINK